MYHPGYERVETSTSRRHGAGWTCPPDGDLDDIRKTVRRVCATLRDADRRERDGRLEVRVMPIAAVSQETALNSVAEHLLGLPRSY